MKNPVLFYGAIGVAIIALALGIYYAIPGIYHPFTFSPAMEGHPTHAAAFFILAVLCVIVALVNRPRPAAK